MLSSEEASLDIIVEQSTRVRSLVISTPAPNTSNSPSTSNAPTTMDQLEILTLLYDTTGGDAWSPDSWDLTSISDPTQVCSNNLYGIECNEVFQVYKISLQNNNLRGTIPTELALLTRLQYLNLKHNFINGDIPTEIVSCVLGVACHTIFCRT